MKVVPTLLLCAIGLPAAPAFAEQCEVCPRVQLLRAGEEIRIAAEDDEDAYADLRHRVRVTTPSVTTAWTEWGETNAYAVTAAVDGTVEAESIDLDGNVGRGVIHITAPSNDTSPTGPAVVEEDSSVEARWENTGESETTVADVVETERPPAADYLSAEEWDHSVCPVASADDDLLCTTTRGNAPAGPLAALFVLVGLLLRRRV
jgi:uncharacterized protein (TIGR03382 family)